MQPHTFAVARSPRTVLFGTGQRAALGTVAARSGQHALVCTDQRLGVDAEFAAMMDTLREFGVRTHVFDETDADLPTANAHECYARHRNTNIDLVLGVGGGSCIDLAKVMSLLLAHGGSVEDYYGEFAVPGRTLPVIAVPTTAGTGSEVTPVAVLSDPNRSMKVGISSPELVPETAICDPELTYTCPPNLTASAGADALSHCIEAYTAICREPTPQLGQQRVFVGKNALSDLFALRGIELLGHGLRAAHDSENETARHDVMLGALYGGYALSTGGTAGAHALQYPIGAATHTSHGVGVGALLPYVMEFNRPTRVPEFAAIARAFDASTTANDDELSRTAVDEVTRLLTAIGIPMTLADLGLDHKHQDWAAKQGAAAARLVQNNPRELTLPSLQAITQAAFRGDRAALRE